MNVKLFKLAIGGLSCLCLSVGIAHAQANKRIVVAKSPKVAIKDGSEGRTRYWNHLLRSATPVRYHLAKNGGTRQVVFYTDMDSVGLYVEAGADYPIDVVLNGRDTVQVMLTTKTPAIRSITPGHATADTIPFQLDKRKQILFQGSINNGKPVMFCLDLGARMVYVIGKGLDRQHGLVIDGLMEDESVTGLSTEKTSSSNSIRFGNLECKNVPVGYIDEAGFLDSGGALLGFNIFQDRVLEIDYDKKLLLVYQRVPEKAKAYLPIDLVQTTGGLYLPLTVTSGQKQAKGLFFFDSGADFALSLDSRFAQREGLVNAMQKIGSARIVSSEEGAVSADLVQVPELVLGGIAVKDVPALMAHESNAEAVFEDGVIGAGLLNRFNMIIDFPGNKMYLAPSDHFAEPFEGGKRSNLYLVVLAAAGIGFILLFVGYRVFQKRD